MLTTALALASAAWACTPRLGMEMLSTPAGFPDTKVTVKGITPGTGQVEIRWDGLRGPLLGTAEVRPIAGDANSSTFSATVTIPPASPGVHYVVAVGGLTSGGTDAGWSRASFTIPGAAPDSEPDPLTADPRAVRELVDGTTVWESSAPQPVRTNPALFIGAVMLAVGGASLVAGFGILGIRRNRAEVRSND